MGCRIVTRLKKNTPLAVAAEQALPDGSELLYDRIGLLPERLSSTRKNPFGDPVREIGVLLEAGRPPLRVVTNDLDAPAQEIADLYKRRWAIELFFRWVKQTLKIRHFIGRSENAVRIQIATALIAYLLLRLVQDACKITLGPLAFARLVRANIMHLRPVDQLLKPPPNRTLDPQQLTSTWRSHEPDSRGLVPGIHRPAAAKLCGRPRGAACSHGPCGRGMDPRDKPGDDELS